MPSSNTLAFLLVFVLLVHDGFSATEDGTSTVSTTRTPVLRPFKLVKIGFIVKPPPTKGSSNNDDGETEGGGSFFLIRPPAPWILVAPTANTTTTTATTTTTTTTKPTTPKRRKISSSLAAHCQVICQRDKYTKKYAYHCKEFIRVGKYYLCWVCRYRKRVCDAMGTSGLID